MSKGFYLVVAALLLIAAIIYFAGIGGNGDASEQPPGDNAKQTDVTLDDETPDTDATNDADPGDTAPGPVDEPDANTGDGEAPDEEPTAYGKDRSITDRLNPLPRLGHDEYIVSA